MIREWIKIPPQRLPASVGQFFEFRVARVLVRKGQTVRAGQPLVEVGRRVFGDEYVVVGVIRSPADALVTSVPLRRGHAVTDGTTVAALVLTEWGDDHGYDRPQERGP